VPPAVEAAASFETLPNVASEVNVSSLNGLLMTGSLPPKGSAEAAGADDAPPSAALVYTL